MPPPPLRPFPRSISFHFFHSPDVIVMMFGALRLPETFRSWTWIKPRAFAILTNRLTTVVDSRPADFAIAE